MKEFDYISLRTRLGSVRAQLSKLEDEALNLGLDDAATAIDAAHTNVLSAERAVPE